MLTAANKAIKGQPSLWMATVTTGGLFVVAPACADAPAVNGQSCLLNKRGGAGRP